MPKRLPKRRKRIEAKAGDPTADGEDQAQTSEPKIEAKDIKGLKFFKKIRPLLDSLHQVGTARDKSSNRDLHMDQYGVLVLMWLFNPILTSLRGLQQASELKEIQKRFGVGRASLAQLPQLRRR